MSLSSPEQVQFALGFLLRLSYICVASHSVVFLRDGCALCGDYYVNSFDLFLIGMFRHSISLFKYFGHILKFINQKLVCNIHLTLLSLVKLLHLWHFSYGAVLCLYDAFNLHQLNCRQLFANFRGSINAYIMSLFFIRKKPRVEYGKRTIC
jgi:hypothetical protein